MSDMSISPERLKQIIAEEVRRDLVIGKVRATNKVLREATQRTSVNISASKSIKFGTLMEHLDKKIISQSEAHMLWERSVNYQLENLLSEGMMDSLRDAYETVKGGAIRLKDKLTDTAKAAMEKVNDFLLKISLQAMNLAQSSVEGIVKAASMLSNAVERFRDNHPILYKIVKILVIMLIIYGIMSLFSGEAQAAVKLPGGGKMSEAQYNTLRGALGEYGGGDVDKIMNAGKAIKMLDKAYQAKEAIPIEELGSMNRAGLDMIGNLVGQAKGGDKEAFDLLMKWQKVGQNLTVR